MVGLLMHEELERMWKEVCMEGVRKTVKAIVSVVDMPTALGTSQIKLKNITTSSNYLGETLAVETLLLINLIFNCKTGF
jgi:hypothetical protein